MESGYKKGKSILKETKNGLKDFNFEQLKFDPKTFTWTSSIESKGLFWSECLLAPRTSCLLEPCRTNSPLNSTPSLGSPIIFLPINT